MSLKKDEIFDKLVKARGGILPIENINESSDFTNILNWVNDCSGKIQTSKKKAPEVFTNFINDSRLNACAIKEESDYYIGINGGVIPLVHSLFYRILSNPLCLENIGDSSKETISDKIYNANIVDSNIININNEDISNLYPKCFSRYVYAKLLSFIALKFLWLHEMGHIINGHLDFIASLNNNDNINFEELDYAKSGRLDVLSKLDYQTLEIDADSWAINLLVQEVDFWVENNQKVAVDLYSDFYSNREVAIFTLLFSIFSMFNIMSINPVDKENLKNCTHPPQGNRQENAMALISTMYLNANNKDMIENHPIIINNVLNECKKSFSEISEVGFNKIPFEYAYSQVGQDHSVDIHNNWENLYEKLSPFSYNNLAPFEKINYQDMNKYPIRKI